MHIYKIRVITKLPNSEQSYKGKVKDDIQIESGIQNGGQQSPVRFMLI